MPYFIKSKSVQGRYRAGRLHPQKGHVWPDKAFTPAELKKIEKDPGLICQKLTDAEAEKKRKDIGQDKPALEDKSAGEAEK